MWAPTSEPFSTTTTSLLADLGGELLQADRGGEPGRAGADDDDVEIHALAFGQRHPRLSFSSSDHRSVAGPAVPAAVSSDSKLERQVADAETKGKVPFAAPGGLGRIPIHPPHPEVPERSEGL